MENGFIKDLKCDLCGQPLTDTDHIGVVSPNEVLCMHCFRHGEEHNYGKIVELNAANYSLNERVKNLEKGMQEEYRRGFYNGQQSNRNKIEEYKRRVIFLLKDYYMLALKSESGAAIELINKITEEIKNDNIR